jgi:hypothetical protein
MHLQVVPFILTKKSVRFKKAEYTQLIWIILFAKELMMKTNLLSLFLLFAFIVKAQSPEEHLEKSVILQCHPIVLNNKVDFFDADIINAALAVNQGNAYNDLLIAGTYILKDKNGATLFDSLEKMYSSTEFLNAFNTKITSYEDAARLSSFLITFNNGLSFGSYFNIYNKWYFTTSNGGFFDADGFIFTCSDDGTIQKIEMQYNIKFELPGEAKSNESSAYIDVSGFSISEEEKNQVLQAVKEKADFSFTTSSAPEFNIGAIEVLSGELTVSEKYDDMESVGKYPFLLIKNGNDYYLVDEKNNLLENGIFKDAIKASFKLKTDVDAQKFSLLIDRFLDTEPEVKAYKKQSDETWFFATSKRYDDIIGVLVLTDKEGNIKALVQNSGSSNIDELRLRMEDPNFKVDYEFKLTYPLKTEIETPVDKNIEIEISFNEDFVNASSAWIATVANGKNVGMSVSTEGLSSPFGDRIPASYLGKGIHKVEYLLMKPGDDYKNPLSKITLTITVK